MIITRDVIQQQSDGRHVWAEAATGSGWLVHRAGDDVSDDVLKGYGLDPVAVPSPENAAQPTRKPETPPAAKVRAAPDANKGR